MMACYLVTKYVKDMYNLVTVREMSAFVTATWRVTPCHYHFPEGK